MANHSIGSIWRRWDLHVHTPESYFHRYPSNGNAWELYLRDLEQLPKEFSVIGINDYIFLDGYRRIVEERNNGRLNNIETILPVVEFRLARFAGSEKFKRVNFHVIFSDALSADQIENQFLRQLHAAYTLSPEAEEKGIQWKGYLSKETVIELGNKIRRTVPGGRSPEFNETDFELGMNNLNVDMKEIYSILEKGAGLAGNYLTAVGKTEWDAIKWNDNTIAEKKNIINKVDMVFTAAESKSAFDRGANKLREQNVKAKLLDCSDAHSLSQSSEKDRIGNSLLWIKADPTFKGLQMALHEYNERVFVGDEPELISRVRLNPGSYIKSVEFLQKQKINGNDAWFRSQKIELNPELVAIIGNRGSGKSALLECIAFAADHSVHMDQTSFLRKFRSGKNSYAENYEVVVEWQTGSRDIVSLNDERGPGAQGSIKHLPQQFIDKLCNEIDPLGFEAELKSAVFSHVPIIKRLSANDIDQLIDLRIQKHKKRMLLLREQLSGANIKMSELEEKLHPAYREQCVAELENMQNELCSILRNRGRYHGVSRIAPDSQSLMMDGVIKEIDKSNLLCLEKESAINEVQKKINSVNRIEAIIDNIEESVKLSYISAANDFKQLDLKAEDVISYSVNKDILIKLRSKFEEEIRSLANELDASNEKSISGRRKKLQEELEELRDGQNAARRESEKRRVERTKLVTRIRQIIGEKSTFASIRGCRNEILYIDNELNLELATVREQQLDICKSIHSEIASIMHVYQELYGPVQTFIDKHSDIIGSLNISFDVKIIDTGFKRKFLDFIAQNKKGTFFGGIGGEEKVDAVLSDTDFSDWNGVQAFLTEIIDMLHYDRRDKQSGARRYVSDQLRVPNSADLYQYLYGLDYLRQSFALTLNNKPMELLSPGERGALLLIFYLLIDKGTVPLLIDQPEENLDNQSVYKVLRPFLRSAKVNRQVVLVTHNPNIAVAAGAEQVVVARMDKQNQNALYYESGSVENPEINIKILDILEGTKPAFENRERKYDLFSNLEIYS